MTNDDYCDWRPLKTIRTLKVQLLKTIVEIFCETAGIHDVDLGRASDFHEGKKHKTNPQISPIPHHSSLKCYEKENNCKLHTLPLYS